MVIKICFIAFDVYPLFDKNLDSVTYTGADIQLYLLAKELAKNKGYEISFVVGNFYQKNVEEYDGIRIYKYSGNIENKFFIMHHIQGLKLFRLLRKINADIYIQRSASTLTGQISSFTKLNRKKFIFMVAHKKDCDLNYSKFEKIFGHYLYPIGIYRYLFGVKNADLIITQNKEQYDLLYRHLDKYSKLIKSAYNIDKKINKNGKYILWVARCIKWKQPEIFIKLAENFPKEKFVMVCPGNGEYKNHIRSLAFKVENIKFVDEVPFNEIDNYFKSAKLFVSTSIHEGFPNTFVQAAKNSTPIISLNINPDNILNDFEIGLNPLTFDRLKEALKNLLNDKKLYNKLSNNAYSYAKQNHDIKNIKLEYEKLIQNLVKT